MDAVLDLDAGCARLAGVRLPLARAGGANVRLGGAAGTVLRPLSFGERSRAVVGGAAAADPSGAVGAAVLAAATVRRGAADELAAEVVALLLAGAGSDGPPFDAVASALAAGGRLRLTELLDCEASLVDRMARSIAPQHDAEPGWTSIRLAEPDAPPEPPAAAAATLAGTRDELAARLLERAQADPVAADVSGAAGRAPGAPPAPDAGPAASPHSAADATPAGALARSGGGVPARRERDLQRVGAQPGRRAAAHAGELDASAARAAAAGTSSPHEDAARARLGEFGADAALVARASATSGRSFSWERARVSGRPAQTAAGSAGERHAVAPSGDGSPPAAGAGAARHPAPPAAGGPAPPATWTDPVGVAAMPLRRPGGAWPPAEPRPAGGVAANAAARRSGAPATSDLSATAAPGLWAGGELTGPLSTAPASADELAALLHDECDLRGVAR